MYLAKVGGGGPRLGHECFGKRPAFRNVCTLPAEGGFLCQVHRAFRRSYLHDTRELEKLYGVKFGHSSVWRALASGRDRALYRNTDDGYWHITAKGKTVTPEQARDVA